MADDETTPDEKIARLKAYKRAYYLKNKAACQAKSKAYAASDPERTRAYKKAWADRNKGYGREHYLKNRSTYIARANARYAADRERLKAQQAAYRAKYPDKVRDSLKRCIQKHHEKVKARKRTWHHHNRRQILAKKKQKYQNLTEPQRAALRAAQREYLKNNRARLAPARRDQQRAYRQKNRRRILAKKRQKYKENAERLKSYYANYRRENRHKARALKERRRMAKVGGAYEPVDFQIAIRAFHSRCAYCGCSTAVLEQDHIRPVTKGGGHTKDNIVPACKRCNTSKGNRLLPIRTVARLVRILARWYLF